jgi:uncharacterized damage-inducible protein DinB
MISKMICAVVWPRSPTHMEREDVMPTVKWFDRQFDFAGSATGFSDVLDRLRSAPDRVAGAVSGLPHDALVARVDGAWSVNENVGHLLDLEPLWAGRLEDIVNGERVLREADLTNRKTHEANHNGVPIGGLVEGFRAAREAVVQRLATLAADEFAKSSLHPRLDTPMRLVDLFFFVAEHDDHHLERIEEITH